MLRRTLVVASRDYSFVQDQIDCAELALLAGQPAIAQALYEIAFLRTGFAPPQLRRQRLVAQETGFWNESPPPVADDGPRSPFSVDAAIAELAALLAVWVPRPPLTEHPKLIEPPCAGTPGRLVSAAGWPPAAQLCCGLCRLMQHPADATALAELATLLDRLGTELLAEHPFEIIGHVGDLERLATGFVLNAVRDLLLVHYDLAFAPFGSPRLFHAAARIGDGALGPYLRSCGNVPRNARELLAMVQLASERNGIAADPAMVERWAVLAGGKLDVPAKLDLVDTLADLGMTDALYGLLRQEVRAGRADELQFRLRDAGLDLRESQLAIVAQRRIAQGSPRSGLEWRILGEICGTFEDVAGAEQAFEQCLALDPNDAVATEHLANLRAAAFDRFCVDGGFGTPPHRRLSRRMLRRAAVATEPA